MTLPVILGAMVGNTAVSSSFPRTECKLPSILEILPCGLFGVQRSLVALVCVFKEVYLALQNTAKTLL